MTRADRLLIAALALVALVAWPLSAMAAGGKGDSVVVISPAGESAFSLAGDQRREIEGATGVVVVEVSQGSVRVVSSNCPDHTCVDTGAVHSAGSVIACVPNQVVVRVGGSADDGFDARIR